MMTRKDPNISFRVFLTMTSTVRGRIIRCRQKNAIGQLENGSFPYFALDYFWINLGIPAKTNTLLPVALALHFNNSARIPNSLFRTKNMRQT